MAHCQKHNKPIGPYAQLPKLLPFLVSGYDTERSKKGKGCPVTYPRVKDHDTGFECGNVKRDKSVFVASMQLAVRELDVPASVRAIFRPDGDEMVIPFCRSMKHGVVVSQTMGVPMHQIHELDIANCFDGVGWSSKTYVQASDKVWGKQENKDDFTHADFKYSAGQQLYAKVKEQIEVDEKRDYVDEGNRSFVENYDTQWKAGKLTDDCLASFLEAFAKDRCAPPSQVPTPATSCEQPAVASKGSDGTSSRPAALDTDLRPKVPVLKPLDGCGGSDVKPKCVVISVFNYKGGVAKTTTAIQLAATLAKKGSKVCLVDADGQCNSTLFQSNRLRKCRRHSPNAKFLQTSCPRTRRRVLLTRSNLSPGFKVATTMISTATTYMEC